MKASAVAIRFLGRPPARRRAARILLSAAARSGVYGLSWDVGTRGTLVGLGDAPQWESPSLTMALDSGRLEGNGGPWELPLERLDSQMRWSAEISAGAAAHMAGLGSLQAGPNDSEEAFSSFSEGFEYARANFPGAGEFDFGPARKRAPFSGAEAARAGAQAAGCRFVAAAQAGALSLGPVPGAARQETGDALSAIYEALGAAYAGTRALAEIPRGETSLVLGALQFAWEAEIPVVALLWDHQLPPRLPGAVLVPSTIEEAFASLREAFDLAEKFQSPISVSIEPALAHARKTVAGFEAGNAPQRGRWARPDEGAYARYEGSEDGISPRSVPGQQGLAHSCGPLEMSEADGKERSAKLRRKREALGSGLGAPLIEGAEEPDFLLVARGPVCALARPVMAKAIEAGKAKIGLLALRAIGPLSADLRGRIAKAKRVAVIASSGEDPLITFLREDAGRSDAVQLPLDGAADPARVVETLREALEHV